MVQNTPWSTGKKTGFLVTSSWTARTHGISQDWKRCRRTSPSLETWFSPLWYPQPLWMRNSRWASLETLIQFNTIKSVDLIMSLIPFFLKKGNIFLVDHAILDGIPANVIRNSAQYIAAPLCLLYEHPEKGLIPIAIQVKPADAIWSRVKPELLSFSITHLGSFENWHTEMRLNESTNYMQRRMEHKNQDLG